MGTGTSKRGPALAALTLVLAGLTLALAGCGGGASGGARHAAGGGSVRGAGAFGWVDPQPPPSSWKVAAISSGAAMAYPSNWKSQRGDPGTATVALTGKDGQTLGYLNLTPRQGSETVADWSSFRVDHNAEEGDKHVQRLAAAQHLRFRDGSGSCVKDAYTTITGARYVEIACLVTGPRADTVIVAAAPPGTWGRESATLERAIESITT